ncbi:hypothetical protein L1987_20993 [Smallanthus sonchifolius]|uniref:Uncharacterized protein n=1 Tax=Smallanthus sonchifolius TaxID=185202 RepID=A0ACB9IUB8_9ASTR|nr:hypothetical protein L1987_20993 [Smallanthus sonchifolius]
MQSSRPFVLVLSQDDLKDGPVDDSSDDPSSTIDWVVAGISTTDGDGGGGFFHSKKSSDISSPEGSNSPRSTGSSSNSPIKSDKKKAKSTTKDEHHPLIGSSFRQNQVKDASNSTSISKDHSRSKKDGAQNIQITSSSTGKPSLEAGTASRSSNLIRNGAAEGPATVSPILASSLGSNRIKTRSGPLPHESFFKFDSSNSKNKAGNKLSFTWY